jgi:uncharacterized DUF497 family protein
MLIGMEFEWDEEKARRNKAKHGIDFFLATEVFSDLSRLIAISEGGYDEVRWITTGLVRDNELVVMYTERGARTRIISARKAESDEREEYWNSRL